VRFWEGWCGRKGGGAFERTVSGVDGEMIIS
jgi:hypothetical protein